jgi:VWFA-related protein
MKVLVAGFLATATLAAQSQPTIRSRIDGILVPVTVTEWNRPVPGLPCTDFELLDNNVPQEFTCAVAESLPIDVTLVIDTSGSLQGKALEQFKSDVRAITESLSPNDRVRVITFAADAADVSGLQPGGVSTPLERITAEGATSLYNALAASLMAFPHADRPQLVFGLTDGIDNMSFVDANTLVSVASHSNALLYLALVSRPVPSGLAAAIARTGGQAAATPNRRLLNEAAARTGGTVYQRDEGSSLVPLFKTALDEFRTSYVLTFTPRGVKTAGWHSVVVRTKHPNYRLRWRRGYDGG